jgi:hypothetical protein
MTTPRTSGRFLEIGANAPDLAKKFAGNRATSLGM